MVQYWPLRSAARLGSASDTEKMEAVVEEAASWSGVVSWMSPEDRMSTPAELGRAQRQEVEIEGRPRDEDRSCTGLELVALRESSAAVSVEKILPLWVAGSKGAYLRERVGK
jgi:hypothetical protein